MKKVKKTRLTKKLNNRKDKKRLRKTESQTTVRTQRLIQRNYKKIREKFRQQGQTT